MRQHQPIAAGRYGHGEQLTGARNDGRLFRIGEIAQVDEAGSVSEVMVGKAASALSRARHMGLTCSSLIGMFALRIASPTRAIN